MPGPVRMVVAASMVLLCVLSITVGAATPAYGQEEPEPLPTLPTGATECNVGVFGRVPSTKPTGAPAWAEPHYYVMWRYDMGFSMVYSCVADVFGHFDGTSSFPPTSREQSAELFLSWLYLQSAHTGCTDPQGCWPWIRSVYALEGVPGRDANGRVWDTGTSPRWRCYGGSDGADNTFANGVDRCGRETSGATMADYIAPLLTDYQFVNGRVRFSLRIDVEPASCVSGDSGQASGAGGTNWRCPVAGPEPDPDTTYYVPRTGGTVFIVPEGYDKDMAWRIHGPTWTEAGTDENEFLTDEGQAVPVPVPGYDGFDPAGGTCEITGFILKNETDGRVWTDSSPSSSIDATLTDGHDHTVTVTFRGRPSTIVLKMRRDGSNVWQQQRMNPSPPRVQFEVEGDGERGLLFATCVGSEGDIHPDGQVVITDESENERATLDECMDDESINWASVASYWRWGVNAVGCLLVHLFVPYDSIEERFYELRSSSEAATWVAGAGTSVKAALENVTTADATSCTGPTVDAPEAGLEEEQPFSVCEGSVLNTPSDVVRAIATLFLIVATILRMLRIAQSAWNGDSVTVYQAEFNTDVNSGGRWV